MSEEQIKVLVRVLGKFQAADILRNLMLIGSPCLNFYRSHFGNPSGIPAAKPKDAGFLIPDQAKFGGGMDVDVPGALRELGFAPVYNRAEGLEVYEHPELRVEFFIAETGKVLERPQDIRKLRVKAQCLRYLDFLAKYPLTISYEGVNFSVPEPAAFALHKLIVSSRSEREEKANIDLESAFGLLDYLYSRPDEAVRIKAVTEKLPQAWLKTIRLVAEKRYPKLNETIG